MKPFALPWIVGIILLGLPRLLFAAAAPAVLNDDAGWCWFQDERAVFVDGRLWAGSVAAGTHDPSRRGNIEVSALDLAAGTAERFVLHENLQLDDHAAPALLVRPDGRVLAMYSKHGTDRLIRYRITIRPGDITEWAPERTFRTRPTAKGATYTNLFRLADEAGRLYNFYRGPGYDPNVIASDDGGESWRGLGRLLTGPGRPYLRYAGNGRDTVHFVCSEQHPRDFNNSLYHGFTRDGGIYDSFGAGIGEVGSRPARHRDLTRIFAGDADNVAWPSDLGLDARGRPVVVYSAQKDGRGKLPGAGGLDHRYRYAWFDGSGWRDHEVGYAGRRLYAGEDDYTGLICLSPAAPGTVYFSADVDPGTGDPLRSDADGERHYELFKGVTADGGASWTITAVTRDSVADQLRPNVPVGGPPGSALLWLSGKLRTYSDYDLEMKVVAPAP